MPISRMHIYILYAVFVRLMAANKGYLSEAMKKKIFGGKIPILKKR